MWTGRQAKEIGLVDELGGLDRAVALAKQRAKIAQDTEVELVIYPPKKSFYDIVRDPFGSATAPRRSASLLGFGNPKVDPGARRAAAGLPPRRAAGADAERVRQIAVSFQLPACQLQIGNVCSSLQLQLQLELPLHSSRRVPLRQRVDFRHA